MKSNICSINVTHHCSIKMWNGKMWMWSLTVQRGGPIIWGTSYAGWHNSYWQRSGSAHSLLGWSGSRCYGCIVAHCMRACCSCDTQGGYLLRTSALPGPPHGHRHLLTTWAPDWSKLFMQFQLCAHHHKHQHGSSGWFVVLTSCHNSTGSFLNAALYTLIINLFKGHHSHVFITYVFIFYNST